MSASRRFDRLPRFLAILAICFPLAVDAIAAPALPVATTRDLAPVTSDWLVMPVTRKAAIFSSDGGKKLILTNGLIRRAWRIEPNAGCVEFDNLMTGAAILRAVKPEASVTLNGVRYDVGGLVGQPDHAYLTDKWEQSLRAAPAAMRLANWEVGQTRQRFGWKRVRHRDESLPWPPPGVSLRLDFQPSDVDRVKSGASGGTAGASNKIAALKNVSVSVHYEMYDGIPLIAKWLTVHNGSGQPVRLQAFVNEILAAVEAESAVDARERWQFPNLHIESDYAFRGMDSTTADRTTHWIADPQYQTQVNYERKNPCLLESRPPIGPDAILAPGATFTSFRTFELVYDSTDRERNGLALRRMYRTLAPWVTENPIMMHLTDARPAAVRRAVDQCAAVGFEMLILSFGSGLNMESTDPAYIAQFKELSDYARSKGVELGGYSLLASRRVNDETDCINPKTGKPGGATFGNSPCLGSQWGEDYFKHIDGFLHGAGFALLEHDGSYPGDVCASTKHPGHRGLDDSQWTQWSQISDFYRQCRRDGIYLNVPDWYFLNGSNKTGMGYRETNWSLPREQQLIHARQNMFDGTWEKTPSMGWMFVPLVQYQGGGAAATIEPLSQHLDTYEAHLANCFGYGVQACYRGPRLYDTDITQALVKRWVDFFKAHRAILESDVIHLRRADGRQWDGILHVNPNINERGLAVIYNPSDEPLETTIELPLYYTGLTEQAMVSQEGKPAALYKLERAYKIRIKVRAPAHGRTWFLITANL
ncbi:MAG TPA: hypothetical protein VFC78_00595 [Tepidisphaeraceae bacterium]|nr:hypothetical protein [Tepidisphaeraceae bacterium]